MQQGDGGELHGPAEPHGVEVQLMMDDHLHVHIYIDHVCITTDIQVIQEKNMKKEKQSGCVYKEQ